MRTQDQALNETAKWQGHAAKNVKLHELAKRCLADADGDVQDAASRLIAIMDAKPSIYRAALDAFKEQAAYAAIRTVLRVERRNIQYQPSPAAQASDAALVETVERNWYDYPLATVRLGDATAADLIAQAKIHELQERGNAHKKRFMQSIAARVPEGSVVRSALSQEEIGEMYKGASIC